MGISAIVAAGIGAAGSVIAGSQAASGAKSAANTAANTQLSMFNQTQARLQPFFSTGQNALQLLANLYGFGSGFGSGPFGSSIAGAGSPDWQAYLAANPDVAARAQQGVEQGLIGPGKQWATPADWAAYQYSNTGQGEGRALPTLAGAVPGSPSAGQSALEQFLQGTPGFQFGLDTGVKALQQSAAARGMTRSGATMHSIIDYGTNYAMSQAWQPFISTLMNAANLGENAAAGTGQLGTQAAAGAANAQLQGGLDAASASANATAGVTNALTSGLQQYAFNYGGAPGGFGSWTPGQASEIAGLY